MFGCVCGAPLWPIAQPILQFSGPDIWCDLLVGDRTGKTTSATTEGFLRHCKCHMLLVCAGVLFNEAKEVMADTGSAGDRCDEWCPPLLAKAKEGGLPIS